MARDHLIAYFPLFLLWLQFIGNKCPELESCWDFCWVSLYYIFIIPCGFIIALLALIIDIIILIFFIIPYDLIFCVLYSFVQIVSCGKCRNMKYYFIQCKIPNNKE